MLYPAELPGLISSNIPKRRLMITAFHTSEVDFNLTLFALVES